MARKTRPGGWIQRFAAFLDGHPRKVFSRTDLDHLLQTAGLELEVPESLTAYRLIRVLSDQGQLQEVRVRREGRGLGVHEKIRYSWGPASAYAVGESLAKGSYLSHASAVFLHGLTDQNPKTVYVNREQSPKPKPWGALTQTNINRAFKREPRKSNYVFSWGNARFRLLSGKNTGRLEVSPIRTPRGELVDCTKLERTLIDIVVRPAYAGGVYEVLKAYQTAVDRVSINTLVAILKTLDHTYPYHQSIGFLLDRCGVPTQKLDKLRELGMDWDFYLDYRMDEPAYDERWRLFYPRHL